MALISIMAKGKKGFQAGESKPKTSGRGKGTKNKKTLTWETFVQHAQTTGLEKFEESMKKLTPLQYCNVFLTLLDFHKPRMQRITHINEDNSEREIAAKLARMSLEELKKLAE